MTMIGIGIDPDVEKSGVCIYNFKKREITDLINLRLWDLFDFMLENKNAYFVIENSDLVKANWGKHMHSVGKNKGFSKAICDFAIAKKIPHTAVKPQGYSQRYKNADVFKKSTGYSGSSNQETRAASAVIISNKMLVLAYYQSLPNL